MQQELDAAGLSAPVTIVGINGVGLESGNEQICDGRDIPWLQDTNAATVWEQWGINYRDVVVVNHENHVVAIFNLTVNNLAEPAHFAALEALFTDAADAVP